MNTKRDGAGRFAPGTGGRPPGTGRAAKLAATIEADMPDILAALVAEAKAGNVQAAGLLLARAVPPMKPVSEPVRFTLPDGSLSEKAHAVLDAVAVSRLPADIGTQLIQALAKTAHIVEIDELERRIADLEARHEHEPTY